MFYKFSKGPFLKRVWEAYYISAFNKPFFDFYTTFIVLPYEFLERLWVWVPVLWRDRDWDLNKALEIFEFKLSRVRQNIAVEGHLSEKSKKRMHRQMTITIELIKRIREDNYDDFISVLYLRKHGLDANRENSDELFSKHYKKFSKKDKYGSFSSKFDKEIEALREQDLNYLNKMFKIGLKNWWD
jgi:hypothetical protein